MPISASYRAALLCSLFAFQTSHSADAQQPAEDRPLMQVTWFGPGAIALPKGQLWKIEMITAYDSDTRPVAQFAREDPSLTVSFIIFENRSGNPSAQGCRKDAIDPIFEHDAKMISKRVDGDLKTPNGETLATTSYLLDMSVAAQGTHQRNLFAFAGNATTCAEIHVSNARETSDADDGMKEAVADFHPDLTYKPTAIDYFMLASLLFKSSPGLAAPYYKSSLNAMPEDESFKTPRRVATDQLVMSLGKSGDFKNSRAVAEMAVSADPGYPLNYYNLACADAEQGNAAQAKIHLQQAFDRRANVLKGESMPNPATDDSILKLKKDKVFWEFVLTLPKN